MQFIKFIIIFFIQSVNTLPLVRHYLKFLFLHFNLFQFSLSSFVFTHLLSSLTHSIHPSSLVFGHLRIIELHFAGNMTTETDNENPKFNKWNCRANEKYIAISYNVKLDNSTSGEQQDDLGIIVSASWQHSFLVIVHVRPNSVADKLGIHTNDRIGAIDFDNKWITSRKLDLRKLKKIVRSKKQFRLTIFRKKIKIDENQPKWSTMRQDSDNLSWSILSSDSFDLDNILSKRITTWLQTINQCSHSNANVNKTGNANTYTREILSKHMHHPIEFERNKENFKPLNCDCLKKLNCPNECGCHYYEKIKLCYANQPDNERRNPMNENEKSRRCLRNLKNIMAPQF